MFFVFLNSFEIMSEHDNDGSDYNYYDCIIFFFQAEEMAPPIETPNKIPTANYTSPPPLNERILSSLTRRSVAAHPWHDLEIGKQCC